MTAVRAAAGDGRAAVAVAERVPAEALPLPVGRHARDPLVDGRRAGDAAERRADALVAEQRDQLVAVPRADRLGAQTRGLESVDGDHGSGKGATRNPWSCSRMPSS